MTNKLILAQMFLEIANDLDSEEYGPLAQEADELVQQLIIESDDSDCDTDSEIVMSPSPRMEMIPEVEPEEESVIEIVEEEEIPLEEIVEPEPEFDKMSLEDFKSKIDSFLRISDRGRKESWAEAAELAEKGIKHLEHGQKYMEKAYKILDDRGEQIRFDIPFKW